MMSNGPGSMASGNQPSGPSGPGGMMRNNGNNNTGGMGAMMMGGVYKNEIYKILQFILVKT